MAEKYVEFQVTGSGSINCWIAVDEHDVRLENGQGGMNLDDSQEHILMWWMAGNPGDSVSIVGKQQGKTVVNVKESKIPNGSNKGAGYRRFQI